MILAIYFLSDQLVCDIPSSVQPNSLIDHRKVFESVCRSIKSEYEASGQREYCGANAQVIFWLLFAGTRMDYLQHRLEAYEQMMVPFESSQSFR